MLVFDLMGYVFSISDATLFLADSLFNICGYYQEFVLLIPDLKMNIGLAFSFISIYQLKKKHFLLWEMLYLLHICRQQHCLIIVFEFDNIWIRSIFYSGRCYLLFVICCTSVFRSFVSAGRIWITEITIMRLWIRLFSNVWGYIIRSKCYDHDYNHDYECAYDDDYDVSAWN